MNLLSTIKQILLTPVTVKLTLRYLVTFLLFPVIAASTILSLLILAAIEGYNFARAILDYLFSED